MLVMISLFFWVFFSLLQRSFIDIANDPFFVGIHEGGLDIVEGEILVKSFHSRIHPIFSAVFFFLLAKIRVKYTFFLNSPSFDCVYKTVRWKVISVITFLNGILYTPLSSLFV